MKKIKWKQKCKLGRETNTDRHTLNMTSMYNAIFHDEIVAYQIRDIQIWKTTKFN